MSRYMFRIAKKADCSTKESFSTQQYMLLAKRNIPNRDSWESESFLIIEIYDDFISLQTTNMVHERQKMFPWTYFDVKFCPGESVP